MKDQPRVLIIGDDQPRMGLLRESLARAAQVNAADDLPHALTLLAKNSYEAVFCDLRFHCGTWREALDSIESVYPDLPVIVVSGPATGEGRREWADVVEAGGFDVLSWSGREPAALTLLEHAVASAEGRALRARC